MAAGLGQLDSRLSRMHPEFQIDPTIIYLNHAAVAPWPRRTSEAITAFAQENLIQGASHYPRWSLEQKRLRERAMAFLNAGSPREIGLVKNTSEAISFVASGLQWQPGDNVVGICDEFPSNRIPWEALSIKGVEYRTADIRGADPEGALLESMDQNTRLLAVSSVQYASGLRLHLERLGSACRQRGILFMVDAIQSLGAFPMDVRAIQADFVMADGHKWLLAPEGLGIFYVAERVIEAIQPTQYGWHMIENAGDYDTQAWSPALSARKFECGSPNMLGIHGLAASLSVLMEEGMDNVSRLILERTQRLMDLISQEACLELLSSNDPGRLSGIVLFKHRSTPNAAVWSHLKNHQVICAMRGGGIRFSPHFYTPLEQLEKAVRLAAEAT
jgi:cysteine desulfurase/selenocysteine lyase